MARLLPPFLPALLLALAASAADFESAVWTFVDRHCLECHDDLSAKGDLDLGTEIADHISGADEVELWTRIFDRVTDGEMPPKKQPRPTGDEIAAFQEWIRPRLSEADAELREVVHRRLNRVEYENTVRDLLHVDLELQELLPEDASLAGFDNNGGALAISADLYLGYLEAARRALDAAVVTEPKPEPESFTVDFSGKKDENVYQASGDEYFTFVRSRGDYSKISTRNRRTKMVGPYRVRFSARSINSETPITFSVMTVEDDRFGGRRETVGYFEAGEKREVFEMTIDLERASAIQFFAHGLPTWVNDASLEEHAAIGFGSVELSGPHFETWPPRSHTALLGGVDPASGTLADAEAIFRRLMPRAYRRPVAEEELAGKLDLVEKTLASGRTFWESLRLGLESILCSPNFLFLCEEDTREGITDFELASRLSYFLWNSMPDAALFDLAEKGRLSGREVLAEQVERMLADPRSDRFVENFTGQWLKLREIDATTPDRKLYPDFDEPLQVSIVAESRHFFRKLIADDLPLIHFIDSDFVMANRRLAEHYELPEVAGWELRPVPLPETSVRGGLLTQASILKVTANGTNTSPVLRGVWVLENMLGKHIPPPPPNIDGIEPDIREATTIREQLDLHRDSESCNACHQYIDPPGFALESFDPVGAYRERYLQFKVNPEHADKGWGRVVKAKPVDASGTMADGNPFRTIDEFKALLLEDSDTFARCLTERLATYALGREMGFSDRESIRQIAGKTATEGNGFRTLIRNLITNPLFTQP